LGLGHNRRVGAGGVAAGRGGARGGGSKWRTGVGVAARLLHIRAHRRVDKVNVLVQL